MRAYNGGNEYDGPLGRGWSHSFDRRVVPGDHGLMEIDGRGVGTVFPPDGQGGFLSPPGRLATARHEADGFAVAYPTGRTFGYGADGKLAWVQEPAGQRFVL